jgi:uncharacterized protein DUF6636
VLRNTAVLGLALILLGGGSALAKQRLPTYGSFKTPSRNIVCGYTLDVHGRASMECGIKSGLKPPPHRIHCLAGDPNDKRLSLRDLGRAVPVLCAGDPGPLLPQIEAKAHVLAYGTRIRIGGITCASAITGLTCRNRSAHGFFLSRQSWRLF